MMTMKGITSCYNERAIRISDSYCSGPSRSSHAQAYLCPKQSNNSVPDSVTSIYKVNLTSQKNLLITLTWAHKLSFTITINSDSHQFTTNKGTIQAFQSSEFKVQVVWDLQGAKYETGPEPVGGFYVVVLVDSELGIRVGDKEEEWMEELKVNRSIMVCRSERFCFYGRCVYRTKARFCESGISHEIVIKCVADEDEEEDEGSKWRDHVLCVCIDKKMRFEVRRLRWNFRGNQAIFVDGLLVDMMWDVHDWVVKGSNDGCGVFMFRTRSGFDSRLWLEDKTKFGGHKDHHDDSNIGFSLLIRACKT